MIKRNLSVRGRHDSGKRYEHAAGRHDTEQTLKWLERAFEIRDAGMLWLKADPMLEFVRNEPRFHVLLTKMHFNY